MVRKGLFIYLFMLAIFSSISCFAQQTLMTEVDNPFIDTLIVYAKKNYPRVKYFEARINAAKANLKKQKLGWFESATLSYVLQPSNGNTSSASNPVLLNGYQFGVFLNIGSLLERPFTIKQAKEEVKEYQQQDPISKVLDTLQKNGWIDEAGIEAIEANVKAMVDESVKFAEDSPYPDADELYKDVYFDTQYPFIIE